MIFVVALREGWLYTTFLADMPEVYAKCRKRWRDKKKQEKQTGCDSSPNQRTARYAANPT